MGIFHRYFGGILQPASIQATLEQVQPAGAPRKITVAAKRGGVAQEPTDEDFANAAVWRIKLPAGIDANRKLTLRLHYIGDVARIYLDGKFIDDNFYNGKEFDLDLRRYAPDIYQKELLVKILPAEKDAPIYIPAEAQPDYGAADTVVKLEGCEVIETLEAEFTAK
jgi:hypothetical protein